jgi:hypothetical protein
MILICDDQMTVREANELALATLSDNILGRPLLLLVANMARSKGATFIDELRCLDTKGVTPTWELMLHVPRDVPLLVGLRGARLPDGGWMIMGSGESSRLMGLYHEVLSLNTELTNLIRQLTRDKAALTRSVNQPAEHKELRAKPAATEHSVAQRLAELRSGIIIHVADQLLAALPIVDLDPYYTSSVANRHAQMLSTAQHLHDLVQMGATIDWSLVGFEYAWAARVLGPKGGSWNHQALLIETYFTTAGRLATWSDDERTILDQLAEHLYADGAMAYGMDGAHTLVKS